MKNWPETFGDIALKAARSGDPVEALDLLKQGADVNVHDRNGHIALSHAAQYDRLEFVHALLGAGADPNIPCKWGMTPLMAAKDPAVAEALLLAGAKVNAATRFNESSTDPAKTALMQAAQSGRLAVVNTLLTHGADANMRDFHGHNALILSASARHVDTAQALIDAGATVGLVEAALLGDRELVQTFLSAEADAAPDQVDSALWWATGSGKIEIARLLLDAGADVNVRGREGITALTRTAQMGQAAATQLLLDRGADVDLRNKVGITALHASVLSATHGCNVAVVRALLASGANVNARTQYSYPTHTGGTALMEAALHGATDCVRVLLECGADMEISSDIDEDGEGGWTALVAAAANNRIETVRLLIESGSDVNNGGKLGTRPLESARKRAQRTKDFEIVELLVAAGGIE